MIQPNPYPTIASQAGLELEDLRLRNSERLGVDGHDDESEIKKNNHGDETRSIANRKPPRSRHLNTPAIYDVPYRLPRSRTSQSSIRTASRRRSACHMLPMGSWHPCFPGAKHEEGKGTAEAREPRGTTYISRTQNLKMGSNPMAWAVGNPEGAACMPACLLATEEQDTTTTTTTMMTKDERARVAPLPGPLSTLLYRLRGGPSAFHALY